MTKTSAHPISSQRTKTFLWLAGLSALGAVFIHIYLLSRHFALKFGDIAEKGKSICDVSATFNCEAVAASRFSEFLGVPMAMWGAAFNIGFLLLLAAYPFTEETKRPAARRNLLLLGGVILAASIVMGGISLTLMSTYCLFCILTYIFSATMFWGLWKGLPSPPPSPAASALGGPRFQIKDHTALLVVSGIAILGSFIANDEIAKSYGIRDMAPFIRAQVQDWENSPVVPIEPSEPLTMGASADQAKMTIVEFADFRCIHCKHAAPVLKAFIGSHPDVRLVFQVWPLDGECNTSINSANGASCLLARAAYCAEKIGQKGWVAHEYIFERQQEFGSLQAVQSALPSIAQATGVPATDFETCTQAAETKTAIERQAAVGSALNLRGTPSIYVNGKLLSAGQSLPVLKEVHKRLSSNTQ